LAEGEEPHPTNYRGCKHAKENKKKSQKAPKTTKGKVFPSALINPGVSFAAALLGSADHQRPQALHVPTAHPPTREKQSVSATEPQQETGQLVLAPILNSQPLDNILRVVTVVQQIMAEFNGGVSEEDKIVAITKNFLNLMRKWPLDFISPSKS
jgi:hypothetical protein